MPLLKYVLQLGTGSRVQGIGYRVQVSPAPTWVRMTRVLSAGMTLGVPMFLPYVVLPQVNCNRRELSGGLSEVNLVTLACVSV